MSHDSRYLIFRVYTEDEVPDPELRYVFYGWTTSKAVAKAFLAQRSKSKYRVRKMSMESIAKLDEPLYDDQEENVMVDYLELESAKTHEMFKILMTRRESLQFEINVQTMMRDACSLESAKGDIETLVNIIVNLKEEYADALYHIGYRPPQVTAMYDDGSDYSDSNSMRDRLESEYANAKGRLSINHSEVNDMYTKFLYSLENFIRVMKDDL